MKRDYNFCQFGQAVIETEAQAISKLSNKIDHSFHNACDLMLNCDGRIIVMGMGKSGHIANKIAATLASTGTPAFFVHPAEACHGDFGMIKSEDVIIALSNSGKSDEILTLLPLIKRRNISLISLTGVPNSPLACAADINIDISVDMEACPLGLAPTTSTTAALVMGDALAIALLEAKGFGPDDFALSHPGGALGRKLLLRVMDIAHTGKALPIVPHKATISEALIEVTLKKLGMACVVDGADKLIGVFTDGDVRRALNKEVDIHTTPVEEIMSSNSLTIEPSQLAAEALRIMQDNQITSLVIQQDGAPNGVVHLHDIIKAGVV